MTQPHLSAQHRAKLACEPEAFEKRYRESADPWHFATSAYEQQRYELTLSSLRRWRYRRAFEPGCSIGVLTAALAQRCDEVFAIDVSPTALARARERCSRFRNVRLENRAIENMPSHEHFDLIVLSEIGYYFDRSTLAALARQLASHLEQGGELIAVHWLGHSDDHVLHGDEVHATLQAHLRLLPAHSERHPGFRLDSWVRL